MTKTSSGTEKIFSIIKVTEKASDIYQVVSLLLKDLHQDRSARCFFSNCSIWVYTINWLSFGWISDHELAFHLTQIVIGSFQGDFSPRRNDGHGFPICYYVKNSSRRKMVRLQRQTDATIQWIGRIYSKSKFAQCIVTGNTKLVMDLFQTS